MASSNIQQELVRTLPNRTFVSKSGTESVENVLTCSVGPGRWASVFLPHFCNQHSAFNWTERKAPEQFILPDLARFTKAKFVFE